MILDEAIKHSEEVAKEKEAQAWEAQLQEEYEKIKLCKNVPLNTDSLQNG